MASAAHDVSAQRGQMPKTILVVDDEPKIVKLTADYLEANGYRTLRAFDGRRAVELVRSLSPDLVILDITMPGMNGIEVSSHIAKLKLGCRILIFTMHGSEGLNAEIRKAGAHGYVQKSQASSDLVQAIECLLQGGTFFEGECTM